MITDFERKARRRKFAQIAAAHATDPERMADVERVQRERASAAPEVLAILARVQASRDVEAFRQELQLWAPKPGWHGFNGVNGHMFVNQHELRPPPGRWQHSWHPTRSASSI